MKYKTKYKAFKKYNDCNFWVIHESYLQIVYKTKFTFYLIKWRLYDTYIDEQDAMFSLKELKANQ